RLLERRGRIFSFEMNMGRAAVAELEAAFDVMDRETEIVDATILNVGNPQCAVFVENFDFDWRGLGGEIGRHSRFPTGTNVSFVRVVDEHTVDVRFFERGA